MTENDLTDNLLAGSVSPLKLPYVLRGTALGEAQQM